MYTHASLRVTRERARESERGRARGQVSCRKQSNQEQSNQARSSQEQSTQSHPTATRSYPRPRRPHAAPPSAQATRGRSIVLLLFLQKQNLANAIYLFGLGTLLSGLGLKHMRIRSHHDLAGTLVTPYSWEDHGGVLRLLPVYPSQCSLLQVTSTDVAFPPFCRSCPCDRHDLSLIFIHRHTPDIYIYIYMYTYIYKYIYIPPPRPRVCQTLGPFPISQSLPDSDPLPSTTLLEFARL